MTIPNAGWCQQHLDPEKLYVAPMWGDLNSIFSISSVFKGYRHVSAALPTAPSDLDPETRQRFKGNNVCASLLNSPDTLLIWPPDSLDLLEKHFEERHRLRVRFASIAPGVAIYRLQKR